MSWCVHCPAPGSVWRRAHQHQGLGLKAGAHLIDPARGGQDGGHRLAHDVCSSCGAVTPVAVDGIDRKVLADVVRPHLAAVATRAQR